jgi:glycogen debranching enzyme
MIAKPEGSLIQPPAVSAAILPSLIDFGRETCCSLDVACDREWLVTNGIGGFASGTVSGVTTRRYHGLLVAALKPPLGRTLLVAKLEETAQYDGEEYALFADRWVNGTASPQGYKHLERFRLDGTTPVWTFACADARLEKRIWMQTGANTTFVQYSLISASRPLHLDLKALINYRDYHGTTHGGDWRINVEQVEHGLRIVAFEGATPFYLLSASANEQPAHVWYRSFDLAAERERGSDDCEDHLHAGTFNASLQAGESATIVCTVEPHAELNGPAAYERHLARQQDLLSQCATLQSESAKPAGPWVKQLVLAADRTTRGYRSEDGVRLRSWR